VEKILKKNVKNVKTWPE